MDNININQKLLAEQLNFLSHLATDLELGLVSLSDRYAEMELTPVEYLDGVCNLLDEINEQLNEINEQLEEWCDECGSVPTSDCSFTCEYEELDDPYTGYEPESQGERAVEWEIYNE